jgi:hypothetical protein
MQSLSRAEIVAAPGAVDDRTISQTIVTGATPGELAEAQAWIANNEALALINKASRLPWAVEILSRLDEEDEEAMRRG